MEVVELHYYPIKSCGGTSLQAAEVGQRGILHDREFMVIDPESTDPKGNFRTARGDKSLLLVQPSLLFDSLILEARGMPQIEVPVLSEGMRRQAVVWGDQTEAIDQGDFAAEWFSDHLKKKSRLVRMPDEFVRKINKPKYQQSEEDQVGYADRYNFLLISQGSLNDLNNRLDQNDQPIIPMSRFRPNIVISGGEKPYIEDTWAYIQIGGSTFKVARDCARCAIPTTDAETLRRSPEPTRTLLQYRSVNDEGAPYFGQNLIHLNQGTLKLRDKVTVLEQKAA